MHVGSVVTMVIDTAQREKLCLNFIFFLFSFFFSMEESILVLPVNFHSQGQPTFLACCSKCATKCKQRERERERERERALKLIRPKFEVVKTK